MNSIETSHSSPYRMTIGLNVLTHLGINLYSNVPAVIQEAVANSWDADATEVNVTINRAAGTIEISDNGSGMSREDINSRYLVVGYRRREEGRKITPILHRKVMGRKGIGKLSLFSIANRIEVRTNRDGQYNGFVLSLQDIKNAIENNNGETTYSPKPLEPDGQPTGKGTNIRLSDLRISTLYDAPVRKRLARRFSIIGDRFSFNVKVNGRKISPEDRGYFAGIEYIWTFGEQGKRIADLCTQKERQFDCGGVIEGTPYTVDGWIGTARKSSLLREEDDALQVGGRESLNKLVIMARGKTAQEDILSDFPEGGVYSKYIVGEIYADFLDLDEEEDITTTSRQRLFEEDHRYLELKEWLYPRLKDIQNKWTELRNERAEKKALEIPEVKAWFESLSSSQKTLAKLLFGRIKAESLETEEELKTVFLYGALAFESLSYQERLDELESLSASDITSIGRVFSELDMLEAAMYHRIVSERMKAVETLKLKVEANDREKIIQQYLFKYPWLLDPSWERATGTEYMEASIRRIFELVDKGLTDEQKRSRIDIGYATASGKHIIIELKRPEIEVSVETLLRQVLKYHSGFMKGFKAIGEDNPQIEIVCVLGRWPREYTDGSMTKHQMDETLKPMDCRIVLYDDLIDKAYKSYSAYFNKKRELSDRLSGMTKLVKAQRRQT
ncbi:MAG: ATP-binding protein [Nitrososphaerota archaeon]|nr:ATP-binding protein [Nitrososphaerota archaeon]